MLTTERKLTRRQRRLKRRRIRGLVNAHKRVDLIYARTDRAILKGFDRGLFERVSKHETSPTEAQGEILHRTLERAVLAYPDEYLVVADKDGAALSTKELLKSKPVEYRECPVCGRFGEWKFNRCLTSGNMPAVKPHKGRYDDGQIQ